MTTSFNPFPGKKRIRMRDVAARCEVSISTVSLVLSGDERIPEETARKVLLAVKALEYRPNIIARNLARRGSRTIAVIWPEFAFTQNAAYYLETLRGIHSVTQPAGFKIVVEATNKVFLERRYYLRMLKEQSADGVIYLAAQVGDSFLDHMTSETFPFILLGSRPDQVNLPVVQTNNQEAAAMAVNHLLSLGHTKVGFLSNSLVHSMNRDRLQGYQAALKKKGLSVFSAEVNDALSSMNDLVKTLKNLVAQNVSALVVASDTLAYSVLKALQTCQVPVPQKMAVVGIDDLDMSAWVTPALTTVRVNVSQLGEIAARTVLKQIQSNVLQKNPPIDAPVPQLIIRESCGAKRA